MTAREESKLRRIKQTLSALRAAAARQAQATPHDGTDSARRASFTERREKAEQKLMALLRQLREAMKRPGGPPQPPPRKR